MDEPNPHIPRKYPFDHEIGAYAPDGLRPPKRNGRSVRDRLITIGIFAALGAVLLFNLDYYEDPKSSTQRCWGGNEPEDVIAACDTVLTRLVQSEIGPDVKARQIAPWQTAPVSRSLLSQTLAYVEFGNIDKVRQNSATHELLLPAEATTLYLKGITSAARGDLEAAIRFFRTVNQTSGIDVFLMSKVAEVRSLHLLGNYEDAVSAADGWLDFLSKREPTEPRNLFIEEDSRIGRATIQAWRLITSEPADTPLRITVESAANYDAFQAQLLAGKGWANFRLNRIEEAIDAFFAASALNPNHIDAVTGIVYILIDQNHLEAAIQVLQHFEPSNSLEALRSNLGLAWLLTLTGGNPEALNGVLDELEDFDLDHFGEKLRNLTASEILLIQAIGSAQRKEHDDAVETYREAIDLAPVLIEPIARNLTKSKYVSDTPATADDLLIAILECLPLGCRPRPLEWCGDNNELPCRPLLEQLPNRL